MQVIFHWIGGATFILSIGSLKIAVDPVLCQKGTVQDYFWFKSERIEEPVYEDSDFNDIDLWLITHNHEDHLDSIGLSKIVDTTKVISNKNAATLLKETKIKNLSVLNRNEIKVLTIKGYRITIEAIPAIHGVNPLSAMFAGKGNGYYLTVSKGKEKIRIYITGDTVYKSKIVKALENKKIDLMIPNMGAAQQGSWIMTLTLNAKMLKKLIDKTNPTHVLPVHYGTFKHYKEPVESIKKIKDNRIKIVAVGSKTNLIIN